MADLDSIKIHLLPPSDDIDKDDLLVIDRISTSSEYITNSVRLGRVIDFITTLDLNFTGDVTFVNTIQPPPTYTLNGIFDNVTVRQSLTLLDGVEVNGISLDDLEGVNVNSPLIGQTLVYRMDPYTNEGVFVNDVVVCDGMEEAPVDGRIYARQNGAWTDITDCIRCPTI